MKKTIKNMFSLIIGILLFTMPTIVYAGVDQEKIVFVSADSGRWELWVTEARDVVPQQLTDTAYDERTPCWSPDGSKIAYATMQGDLHIVDVASGKIEALQLPSISNVEPAWEIN